MVLSCEYHCRGKNVSKPSLLALVDAGVEIPVGEVLRDVADNPQPDDDERAAEQHRNIPFLDREKQQLAEPVAEPLRLYGMDDAGRRRAIVEDLLERVGLSPDDADRYPHEFSGGEKQRLAIARALVVNPDLIVADEPTSALDSRIQSDVLALLAAVRREFDIAVVLISHDIDVVRLFCDRVAVMYLGEIVEQGHTRSVLEEPAHPYTRVLLGSVPSLDPTDRGFVDPLTDTIPEPADPPGGCRFHTRCPEIIPPSDVDLPAAQWRAVAAFRFALQARELPERFDAASSDSGVDPGTVRAEFELPPRLADSAVDSAVTDAAQAVARGEIDRAAERLAGALSTVCERAAPANADHAGRPVRCHRYDPAVDGEP